MSVATKKPKAASPPQPAPPAPASYVDQIGETAGVVWHTLNDHGKMTLARLQQMVKAQPTMVQHAIGWLAREGKIEISESGRSKHLWLK